MVPVIVDRCFAWLHTPPLAATGVAIVICPGLRADEASGYSGLRLLADAFSERGYTTLRLQYLGTGDSDDPDHEECWDAWQRNIHAAANWLRNSADARQIVLCGFRFGALLAATVGASRSDTSGLILLAPVLRGRSYIRQLVIETNSPSDGPLDLVRFRLSPKDVATIGRVELRKITLPGTCKIGTFAQTRSAALAECEAAWGQTGVEVTSHGFAGLEPLLRPTFAIHEKSVVSDSITTWLASSLPATSRKAAGVYNIKPIEITLDRCTETPVSFGPSSGLFGILCRPQHPRSRAVVLMGNSSGDPHCTATTVNLARHLAAGGVASLRFDFTGIGDSVSIGDDGHVFETNRTADFSAAIDVLQQLGYNNFAVEGLCSGAYHAYHAALGDQRIAYALLVNLPFFKWTPGFPVDQLIFDARKPTDFVQSMHTKAFWATLAYKIRHGDLNVRRRFAWLENKLRQLPGSRKAALGPIMLSTRAKALFLVAKDDVGVEVLRQQFGSGPLPSGVEVVLVPGLDHAMTRPDMRRIIAGRIVAFLAAASTARCAEVSSQTVMSPPPRHVPVGPDPVRPNTLMPG